MKGVFCEAQMEHCPKRYLARGNIIGYPDQPERTRRLKAGAEAAGLSFIQPDRFGREAITALHPERYVDFLEGGFAEWIAVPGAFEEMMPSIRPLESPSAYPRDILGRAGWHQQDFSCPLTADTWGSVKASADTALTAAKLVLGGERATYALSRPPGHHAYAERAGGFCFLNNSGLAAQALRGRHERVAILDIDVHHGNGTQGIFYARSDVLTVSIHADPRDYYPFFYGHAEQRGEGAGEGFNLNLPLPVKSGDGPWEKALGQALARIADFAPGALVLALGLDAHEADPLKGGDVTTQGLARMAAAIAGLKLPTVIVQEGGYLTDYLSGNLTAFLEGFQHG